MVLNGRLVTKLLTVILLCTTLVFLHKTFLSTDIQILRWLVQGIKFADYQGQVDGLLNMGDITYNITHIRLSKITMEDSEMSASSLRHFPKSGPSYLNVSLYNGNVSFRANWSYSMWSSLEDQGEMTLDIDKAYLNFSVKLNLCADARGLINVTITDCAMRISSVDIDFKNASSLIYESVKSGLKRRAEKSLAGGLCKVLRGGVANQTNRILRESQLRVLGIFLPGEPLDHPNVVAWFGGVFVNLIPTAVSLVHNFGVTFLLMLVWVMLYLVYETVKCALILRRLGGKILGKDRKVDTTVDKESKELSQVYYNPVGSTSVTLNDVAEHVTTKKHRFISRLRRSLWWQKAKEN